MSDLRCGVSGAGCVVCTFTVIDVEVLLCVKDVANISTIQSVQFDFLTLQNEMKRMSLLTFGSEVQ